MNWKLGKYIDAIDIFAPANCCLFFISWHSIDGVFVVGYIFFNSCHSVAQCIPSLSQCIMQLLRIDGASVEALVRCSVVARIRPIWIK
ncbi:hypothetical protein ACHAWO_013168 [Cyclotella atomus]|uniref:Uncharacterized protein n=1 Tax=Cyclotella atomus TaxID=382360 RepID=A0ABD3MQA8_9STRA